MFSTLTKTVKGAWNRMFGSKTIENTLKITPCISNKMEHAIALWDQMYRNESPWLKEPNKEDPERVTSLGLPAMIASEKARTALIEFKSEITTPTEEIEVDNPNYTEPEPDEFGNIIPSSEPKTITEDRPIGDTSRAEFLNKQYEKLKKKLRTQVEYGIAKGGLVIKPYVVKNKNTVVDENGVETEEDVFSIEFDFIQANCFYPLAFDASGNITEAAFLQSKVNKEEIFYRLELHEWKNNSVTITNKAYKNNNIDGRPMDVTQTNLGKEINLSEVPEWKDLQPKVTLKNVAKPLFAYFKMPEANTIDVDSPLGVSGFARAVSLIKDADNQYSSLLWEYEAGEMAVDIDRDALNFVKDAEGGHSQLSRKQQRLYRDVDLGESNTYNPYAPALRDASYTNGLNEILMRIEDVVSLSRGTLSNVISEARTATELKILKQRSYQANADIQQAIQDCLDDVIYAMDVYCTLYEITVPGEYDVSYEWDDSIITDVNEELGHRITLQDNALASRLENRMWYFGETERQAQEALQKIDGENMANMENDLAMQANQLNMNNRFGG